MRLDTALLCEAATVRDGLLHILGGGITQVAHREYPAELGLTLALRIMVPPAEMHHPHQIQVVLQDEDGNEVVEVRVEAQAARPELLAPDEEGELLIPWSFPGRPKLPKKGRYTMQILIDGQQSGSVPLRAMTFEERQAQMEAWESHGHSGTQSTA